ncbi:peptidoglycan-binding domain-containing protein [Maritimibacter dapengensis]|uniref:Peptidoglycan-binding protein n=1 Tax=Maritimibacter dapengensis TaxID=2836868 RepID=A0ABS6SY50_9RHOB|nr:peptidoglycan-binding domain-containing protein [Maritimibacter dapengensis]MBV7377893.1 peptidoglycan-binding protein [Maritimibacter dapengensis]
MFRATIATIWVVTLGLALSGCAERSETGKTQVTRADFGDEAIITDFTLAPPGAKPGVCYGKDVTPATIEQVITHKMVAPAKFGPEGNIITPAKYESNTEARIVEDRTPIYFETPCPPRWTPDFIASIQRALTARGLYAGDPHGTLDEETRKAIRAFQMEMGLNSAILSTESARELGLVEIDLS